MFGFTHMPELIILLLLLAVVLGPKRLPDIGHGLGKAIRNFRQETDAVRAEAMSINKSVALAPDGVPDAVPAVGDSIERERKA
jgi:TatA/E family protein of Tat protein translocase